MTKALLVYGTRPEAIKMAPLIPALRAVGVRPAVAVTGQHREMLDQVNDLFGIVPDFDLDIAIPRQSLAHITSCAVAALNGVVQDCEPDVVLVQGDTSTAFAGALAAFYEKVPVVHVEAGLRTGKLYSPFPEEANRRLTAQLAGLHLAPTRGNRENLVAEGIDPRAIAVTGNTVIDALLHVSSQRLPYTDPTLKDLDREATGRIILVTTHRRESWGGGMAESMAAVRRLAKDNPEYAFVLPIHRNPAVREVVQPTLEGAHNILLIDPLDYGQFARLLADAYLVLTDSGGIQEEAPGLGKPVLVLRDDTERPEGVAAGTVKLVGTNGHRIYVETSRLLHDASAYDAMVSAKNPYGDGRAAHRCAAAVAELLGLGARLPDFTGE